MFIQIETTPNPEALKFMPGIPVMHNGVISFDQTTDTKSSLLASRLLSIDGVMSVMFGSDFISVTKNISHDWLHIKPHVISTMMDYFVAGLPVIDEVLLSQDDSSCDESTDPIVKQIIDIINNRVRPSVAQDGGDITFDRFEDGIVYLNMHGACAGCPSSTATLKSGIENMLRYYVPEVLEVRSAVA